ncbi:MAG: hypothetical protein JWO10_2110 [Microbacteriaceae bacterium]|nr:hypothetical protein [Microbacteriaceae bacterium]
MTAVPNDIAASGSVGGTEHRDIVIVDYDPAWPERFRVEHERIRSALGARARRIDHVGSTSVPGLAAKAIVDIQVSVEDVEADEDYLPQLIGTGYQLRVREDGHRLVRTAARDVQVHICSAGSEWERSHLLFRDWLRHNPADREIYAALKRELAKRDWPSMDAYSDAKTELIAEITERAEASRPKKPSR